MPRSWRASPRLYRCADRRRARELDAQGVPLGLRKLRGVVRPAGRAERATTPATVAVYLAALAKRGRKASTIERALAGIAWAQRSRGHEWPKRPPGGARSWEVIIMRVVPSRSRALTRTRQTLRRWLGASADGADESIVARLREEHDAAVWILMAFAPGVLSPRHVERGREPKGRRGWRGGVGAFGRAGGRRAPHMHRRRCLDESPATSRRERVRLAPFRHGVGSENL
jgi:hypothetical protein